MKLNGLLRRIFCGVLLVLLAACRSTADTPNDSPPGSDPIRPDITSYTPSQMEGPYYPPEKPADRDNDLLSIPGSTGRPDGEALSLAGVVYDSQGFPVEGAVVEIWQTDSSGAYLHPNDPRTNARDRNFQFYGESETGADGVYSFRTLMPGRYENRPRHIHVKVRLDGAVVLTTQFYFEGEVNLTGDEALLLIRLAPAEDDEGRPIWIGERDIVLNLVR